MSKEPEAPDFMTVLEKGIRDVIGNRKAKASEKVAAITAGTKLLMVKHKITGDDTESFFK